MSERDATIVVSPGRVSLDELAQVLAGSAVVLDPSFWPRVEAASAIVAKAAASIPGSENWRRNEFRRTRPRCCSATSSSRIAAG